MAQRERLRSWFEEETLISSILGPTDEDLEFPLVDVAASAHEFKMRIHNNHHVSPALAAGDLDAVWEMAESSGEQAACGSEPTPDQNCVEEIAEAMGIHYDDYEILNFGAKEHSRDVHRWELDPASSEDYFARASMLQRRPPQG